MLSFLIMSFTSQSLHRQLWFPKDFVQVRFGHQIVEIFQSESTIHNPCTDNSDFQKILDKYDSGIRSWKYVKAKVRFRINSSAKYDSAPESYKLIHGQVRCKVRSVDVEGSPGFLVQVHGPGCPGFTGSGWLGFPKNLVHQSLFV